MTLNPLLGPILAKGLLALATLAPRHVPTGWTPYAADLVVLDRHATHCTRQDPCSGLVLHWVGGGIGLGVVLSRQGTRACELSLQQGPLAGGKYCVAVAGCGLSASACCGDEPSDCG